MPTTTQIIEEERQRAGLGEGTPAAALCISGGGIRSATFGLGVLQGLASLGLLARFDYLSTVSGGGYVGSWLSAWICRQDQNTARVQELLAVRTGVEAEEIHNLRRYSNYLTPRLGMLSRDTWVAIAIYIRNLFLNWSVLIPVLFVVLLVPRVLVSATRLYELLGRPLGWWALGFFGLALISVVYGLLQHKFHRRAPGWVFVFCVGSVLLTVLSASVYFFNDKNRPAFLDLWFGGSLGSWIPWAQAAAAMVGLLLVHEALYRLSPHGISYIFRLALALVTALAVQAFALYHVTVFFLDLDYDDYDVYVCLAGPLLSLVLVIGGYAFTGLSSKDLDDLQREWLSSVGSLLLTYAVLWSACTALVLFVPRIFDVGDQDVPLWLAKISAPGGAIGTLITGAITAWKGFSSKTPSGRGAEQSPKSGSGLTVKIALPLLLLFIIVGLARVADPILRYAGATMRVFHKEVIDHTDLAMVLTLCGLGIVVGLFLSRFIDVNHFSMHAFYRNRLIRAYLAASRVAPPNEREPDPTTGFDPKDDLKMSDLAGQRPLHVVNMSLNLVKGGELAWQERKAESFIATPYYCGASGEPGAAGSFCPSAEYGRGITLGTAVAISGAAANPNMGYSSSPVLEFLMTLLNVRLGWWLPNPARKHWERSGPGLGLMWLFMEAFGWTDDQRAFVNVSDGGHFENLAAYEMIRRRCGYIVISDGGADPNLCFQDLSNLIRRVRVDFEAEIVFETADLAAIAARQRRWAVASISYPNGDSGMLLYLKPVILAEGLEPLDVLEYHRKCPAFPHEPTLDQFFTESQFESYRRLGLYTVETLPASGLDDIPSWFGGAWPRPSVDQG